MSRPDVLLMESSGLLLLERETRGDMTRVREEVVRLEPLAVRLKTAADMLECSPTTVWRMLRAGKLHAVKVGSDERITVASIRALLEARA